MSPLIIFSTICLNKCQTAEKNGQEDFHDQKLKSHFSLFFLSDWEIFIYNHIKLINLKTFALDKLELEICESFS